jgi:hypothetical protein
MAKRCVADEQKGKMKRLFLMIVSAGNFAYPQTALPTVVEPKIDFSARLKLYVIKTYTDPWRHLWLVEGVAADDFAFKGIRKWGTGMSGFGESLAPVYGRRVINNTLEFAAGAIIGDDARYRPSTSRELVKRGLHAVGSTFTARAASGNTRPAYSRILAVTAALLIANRWQPLPKTGCNLAGALVFNVTDMAQDNLLQEFTPDLKRFGSRFWGKIHRDAPIEEARTPLAR